MTTATEETRVYLALTSNAISPCHIIYSLICASQQPYEVGTITVILYAREQKHREHKELDKVSQVISGRIEI